ncbi:MAG: KpsF/GutQ family sugar-phosphate isomerase [Bacteroidales bacterium]|jgi:arabinose-5-phosphate isomerase|nr:KpsF/GutQ family sugar-phosphate isomerase [Bacteroidales bacterium]HHV41025.1 KpsF/GutQ family sugar-phosphate isomerase [Bacteroidales bacterium]
MNIPWEDIQKTAFEVIEKEQHALDTLRKSIDASFYEVVKSFYTSKGRIVITGIGKSALVGQKMAATFNSTGTPALFMHAADALHGDVGMVGPEDIVLCLSKSGETEEFKVLAPLIKQAGNLLIAMVANKHSYLARCADFTLVTVIPHEACSNNLIPTSSSTAQMVLGDVLAICLLKLRGFTPEDFARFHPGGTLGKRMYLKVSDIMNHQLRPVVHPKSGVKDTLMIISENRLGATAVLDEKDTLCGIITDGDVRRMLEKNSNPYDLSAADMMTRSPKTILYDKTAIHAYNIMQSHKITQLIVLKDKIYVGMVHIHDIIREGIV